MISSVVTCRGAWRKITNSNANAATLANSVIATVSVWFRFLATMSMTTTVETTRAVKGEGVIRSATVKEYLPDQTSPEFLLPRDYPGVARLRSESHFLRTVSLC